MHESARTITMALGPGDAQERDLTVVDWSLVRGLSPDGKQALLEEEGTGSSANYDIYMRATDGSAPVRLGEGHPNQFSADMKWVLASRDQLFLIPLGPGEQQQITHDAIDHGDAYFLPGEKSVTFTGIEAGHKRRIYVQGINGGLAPDFARGRTRQPSHSRWKVRVGFFRFGHALSCRRAGSAASRPCNLAR